MSELTEKLQLRTYAKLNLMLRINGINEIGYHDLFMVNQSLDLYDYLKFEKNDKQGIVLDDGTSIDPQKNFVYKSAKYISDNYTPINLNIYLKKNIPMFAGLGGGSADAAATIFAINRLYKLNLSNKELIDIAKNIGADVPFCIFGGSKIVKGVGEKLTDINLDSYYYLLIKPNLGMSTKIAFKEYDERVGYTNNLSSIENIVDLKDNKIDIEFIKANFYNDFEKVMLERFSVLNKIKTSLYKCGADFAQMTGSGTTMFGIFHDKKTRNVAYYKLKNRYDNVYRCQSTDKGIKILS